MKTQGQRWVEIYEVAEHAAVGAVAALADIGEISEAVAEAVMAHVFPAQPTSEIIEAIDDARGAEAYREFRGMFWVSR